MKDVKDELREGDQVMVKVLGIEGNRIKLSRKALLKEQRAKLGLPETGIAPDIQGSIAPTRPAPAVERQPSSNASTITIEGGEDFGDFEGGEDFDPENEPNFNRADGAPVVGGVAHAGAGASNAGPGGQRRRRRRPGGGGRGRGPGSGGGGRGPR